jgi:beta-1,4-mannosyl-glycoprotein beta-1,4-N-acetylglucosaminyltransferase
VTQRPRIYDCFCFFNEVDLLKLRLETLESMVDVFVVIEATKTFTGRDKPLHYDPRLFSEHAEKIRHIVIDKFPFDFSDPWRAERYQRNSIIQGLGDARPQDWILVGDVDEIPDPGRVQSYEPAKFARGDFEQRNFAYYINNCHIDEAGMAVPWYGTKVTTFGRFTNFFRCAEQVRRYKGRGVLRVLQRAWFHRFQVQRIDQGGWHFSWLNGADGIVNKLESFSHQEFNTPEIRDPSRIAAAMSSGKDILNLGARFRALPVDESFPEPLRSAPARYGHWIHPHQSQDKASSAP